MAWDVGSRCVLITGATSGIGLALAERFLAAGSTVIAVGRREALLAAAKEKHPGLHTRACDVADAAQRVALRDWAMSQFPQLDTLINNAGIQRHVGDLAADEDWASSGSEVQINLSAPVHLCRLFLPHMRRVGGTLVNVTSGLAFVPKTDVALYCATKAALHSFTLSLRALEAARGGAGQAGGGGGGGAGQASGRGGGVRVVEIVPPAVDTDLGGAGLHTFGAPLKDFADSVMKDLAAGQLTVYFGFSGKLAHATGDEWDKAFGMINSLGK